MSSALVPEMCRLQQISAQTPDIKLLRLQKTGFNARPGQFAMLSLPGVGEAAFSVCGQGENWLEFAVKRAGLLTEALHELEGGEILGLRGPYGNGFPLEAARGRDLLFIGGGVGLAALRSFISHALLHRSEYGRVDIVCGARSPEDLLFKQDLYENWPQQPKTSLFLTVEQSAESWQGQTGLVTDCLRERAFASANRLAIICGPQPMLDACLPILAEQGFCSEQIILTLERRMACGVGQCGRCNIGGKYVCRDGPVFTKAQLDRLPGRKVEV